MSENVIKYLGDQTIIYSNQVTHPKVERAIFRDDTLIIDWADEKHNRVLVTIKRNKDDEWTGKYEKGEYPKEEGLVDVKVFTKDKTLGIWGKLLADSGDSTWFALLEQVEKFPDEK
jgi:hypothetical protein